MYCSTALTLANVTGYTILISTSPTDTCENITAAAPSKCSEQCTFLPSGVRLTAMLQSISETYKFLQPVACIVASWSSSCVCLCVFVPVCTSVIIYCIRTIAIVAVIISYSTWLAPSRFFVEQRRKTPQEMQQVHHIHQE